MRNIPADGSAALNHQSGFPRIWRKEKNSMFHLMNDVGSAHRFTESEAVRDELLQLGYTEVAEMPAEVEAPKEEKKPRATGGKDKKANAEKKED